VTPPRFQLEIAVASVDDALAAQAGGADRIELSCALGLGGLTPSLGTLIEVKRTVRLPVMCLVRPRAGGFAYSDREFRTLQRDVDLAMEYGADGVVFGILHADGTIDTARCRQIVEQIGKRQAVFHRAFDVTPDPFAALDQLMDIGVWRVLTSGQEESAYNGAALIAELKYRTGGRLEVLPAAGINRFTVADVLARTGCDQVHASLRRSRADRSPAARPQVGFEDRYDATLAEAVAEMRRLLDAHPTINS
jgi:copper homeostasis protein